MRLVRLLIKALKVVISPSVEIHVTIKSKFVLSRCQIRQEQAAFGQFFWNVIIHTCRDQKKCKAFF